jgi:hypothetical protein
MTASAVRRIMEEIVPGRWPVYSPFARAHFGHGKATGWAEGWTEGAMDGLRKGWARALFAVLAAREIDLPEDARERIEACAELGYLAFWMDRAARAESLEDVFD